MNFTSQSLTDKIPDSFTKTLQSKHYSVWIKTVVKTPVWLINLSWVCGGIHSNLLIYFVVTKP